MQLTGIVNVVGPPVTLASQATFAAGTNPYSVAVGDVNGDGKPDLVVANTLDHTRAVLLNTTAPGDDATFAAQQTFATGTEPYLRGGGATSTATASPTSSSPTDVDNTVSACC